MAIVQMNSSAFHQVEYHPKKNTLDVYFNDGTVSTYGGVPKEAYQEFLKANSHGRYFNFFIRGVYREV